MREFIILFLILLIISCGQSDSTRELNDPVPIIPIMENIEQVDLDNEKIKNYSFLNCMYSDDYYPNFLVDECKQVLLQFCMNIEHDDPESLNELYALSRTATIRINMLQNKFFENGSEIETVARECLAINFENITLAYGFNATIEKLIEVREW